MAHDPVDSDDNEPDLGILMAAVMHDAWPPHHFQPVSASPTPYRYPPDTHPALPLESRRQSAQISWQTDPHRYTIRQEVTWP